MLDAAVLMPVLNEEKTIGGVLDAIREVYHHELIVVNDGSTDKTAEVLATRDDILVVTHPENLGYGRSLADGFLFARFAGIERLVTMDCDGQHEPKHIAQFLTALDEGWDIVSGSRYLPESGVVGVTPEKRRLVNERVSAEINKVTGWGITDAFCGFKAYRLGALDGVVFEEPGYAMPMEMWAKAYRRGLKVHELPTERIYFDHDRTFGEHLDDPDQRFAYYMSVWDRALLAEEE